jgi:hypothetical protein
MAIHEPLCTMHWVLHWRDTNVWGIRDKKGQRGTCPPCMPVLGADGCHQHSVCSKCCHGHGVLCLDTFAMLEDVNTRCNVAPTPSLLCRCAPSLLGLLPRCAFAMPHGRCVGANLRLFGLVTRIRSIKFGCVVILSEHAFWVPPPLASTPLKTPGCVPSRHCRIPDWLCC